MNEVAEKKETLWILTISPLIWAAHFLASYITAALWCEKVVGTDGSLSVFRLAIAIYTVLALIGIGITAWYGIRRHRLGRATVPHDFDTPEDRHRFLGFATVLLSGVSAVAVLYAVMAAVFIGSCF